MDLRIADHIYCQNRAINIDNKLDLIIAKEMMKINEKKITLF